MAAVTNNRKTGEMLKCAICGKETYRKKSQIEKMKDRNHACCSQTCTYKLRAILYSGNGNHQYGIKGFENASWKSDVLARDGRYKEVRVASHPFRNKVDFVPNYILVAEKYMLNEINSVTIDGKLYLNPEYVVHHIDFDKTNDNVSNLYLFDNASKHTTFHNIYGTRVNSIEEFEVYYRDKYTNKINNRDWLYRAFVLYGLSSNKISIMFDIPYKSVSSSVEKFGLRTHKINRDIYLEEKYKESLEALSNELQENHQKRYQN